MTLDLPDYHNYEEFKLRLQKLNEIKTLGVDPYPHNFHGREKLQTICKQFEGKQLGDSAQAEIGQTDQAVVAGRLVLFRAMGKNAFAHIQDDTGRLQVMFNRDTTLVHGLSDETVTPIKFIEKKLDLGDIIGIEGHLFWTHKGELTLYAKKVTLLCKTLLPLPDKHSGLSDKGTRYRKRWLDLISNQEVMQTFQMRSKILHYLRQCMVEKDFIEVETPVLQNTYGGAEARPFTTHINALDQDMFLRISLEIPLKKLIVGGLDRIFEIGKVFRNEGIDRTHNPEFTMIEAYASYWDYEDIMQLTENLFESISMKLFGTTKIGLRTDKQGGQHEIDLKTPWTRITMKESILKYADINVDALGDSALRDLLEKTDVDRKKLKNGTRGQLIALLFEEFVEKHLIQPHFITDHPIETTPLCKLHREEASRNERIVERFETFILGFEFCNAYSELNDPVLQRELLLAQAAKKQAGDEEAHPMDEEFIEAICQGMPPTGGLGIGIDRMTMLFTGATSIRDVLYFPIMRPGE